MQDFNTKIIGKNKIFYEKIDSTQKEIWRRIEKNNIENGTIIVADIQTDGIGTHGRKWYKMEGSNLSFSLVLFPNIKVSKIKDLTVKIAEIWVSIFKEKYGICIDIKEPNDLMIKNRKLGGILTQTKLQGNIVKSLVIGIGINTNGKQFDKEIQNIATSIKNEFKIDVDNSYLINKFAYELEKQCEWIVGGTNKI